MRGSSSLADPCEGYSVENYLDPKTVEQPTTARSSLEAGALHTFGIQAVTAATKYPSGASSGSD